MAKVRGLDHFTKYFSDLHSEFVVIGGTAASVLMEDNGLDFRLTKDIDLVILAYPSRTIADRIVSYVKLGGYQTHQATSGTQRYHRFLDPKSADVPVMIEVFAKNSAGLILDIGQYIIPIESSTSDGLSAILLDDEYFELIKSNCVKSERGHSIINQLANICMKARAYCEMIERKNAGESVDSKHIDKHRNDILKLAQTLTGQEKLPLSGRPKRDLTQAMQALGSLKSEQIKGIMQSYGIKDASPIIEVLRKVFF